jgi:hypothetical protein
MRKLEEIVRLSSMGIAQCKQVRRKQAALLETGARLDSLGRSDTVKTFVQSAFIRWSWMDADADADVYNIVMIACLQPVLTQPGSLHCFFPSRLVHA